MEHIFRGKACPEIKTCSLKKKIDKIKKTNNKTKSHHNNGFIERVKMNINTLFKLSYGMYVVNSKKEDAFNGQIANTVFQVTAEPPQISVCINKENLTHQFIQKSRVFTVSILERDVPMEFIGRFGFKSGKEVEKFTGIDYKLGITGAPVVIQNCLGYLECEVTNNMDVGTHTVFIGKVAEAEVLKNGEPMTYAYYHKIKGGRAPKTAPTYIKEQ
ncbi:MAG: flavin reductase [Bacteroidales bacterium]|nr:flavin reductase [Bacteroidales bacterium]